MTTIAVRANVMACDSRADGEYAMTVDKIVRLPDGGVAGGAGSASATTAVLAWLAAGEKGDPPDCGDSDYYVLILRPDGSIWRAECRFPAFRILDDFAATGSGSPFAMAAMDMGATAMQAVAIAAKYDTGTGGAIRSLAIKPARGRRK